MHGAGRLGPRGGKRRQYGELAEPDGTGPTLMSVLLSGADEVERAGRTLVVGGLGGELTSRRRPRLERPSVAQ